MKTGKAYIIDENEVEFLSVLGEGTAGTVYKGKYRGMVVAIKVMLGASEAETEEFCKVSTSPPITSFQSFSMFFTWNTPQEFNLVSSVRSPNVVPLFGVIIGKKALSGKLCMVMVRITFVSRFPSPPPLLVHLFTLLAH